MTPLRAGSAHTPTCPTGTQATGVQRQMPSAEAKVQGREMLTHGFSTTTFRDVTELSYISIGAAEQEKNLTATEGNTERNTGSSKVISSY